MKLYDTHAHVYAGEYGERAEELLASLAVSEIFINNIGTDRATSEACVDTAQRYPQSMRAVVGLHPDVAFDQRNPLRAWTNQLSRAHLSFTHNSVFWRHDPGVTQVNPCQ